MASAIDATKPVAGSPTTQSVRDNFATAASEITALQSAPNQTITLSGDIAGSGTAAITATLPTVNANVGTFQGLTVNAKGLVTAATNQGYATTAQLGNYLPLAGGTVTGPIQTNGNRLVSYGGAAPSVACVNSAGGGPFGMWNASSNFNFGMTDSTGAAVAVWANFDASANFYTTKNFTASGNYIAVFNASNPTLAIVNTNPGVGEYMGVLNSSNTMYFALLTSGLAYSNSLATLDASGNLSVQGGTATKPGGGSWVAPSSIQLKTDVVEYNRGLAAVIQLNPVLYSYNGRGGLPATGERYAGLSAEDVAPVMPEMIVPLTLGNVPKVEGEPPPEPPLATLGIDTGPLVMALVNAVKELSARIEALEAR